MSCYLANGCEADLPSAGLADGWGLVFIILYFYNMRGIFGSWFSDFHITMKLSKLSLMLGLLACVLDFEALSVRMEGYGPDLGMPHTRALGNGLFEIRVKGEEGIGRAFFCTMVGRKIIILHSFIKKTDKTPKRELDIAFTRQKEVINNEL